MPHSLSFTHGRKAHVICLDPNAHGLGTLSWKKCLRHPFTNDHPSLKRRSAFARSTIMNTQKNQSSSMLSPTDSATITTIAMRSATLFLPKVIAVQAALAFLSFFLAAVNVSSFTNFRHPLPRISTKLYLDCSLVSPSTSMRSELSSSHIVVMRSPPWCTGFRSRLSYRLHCRFHYDEEHRIQALRIDDDSCSSTTSRCYLISWMEIKVESQCHQSLPHHELINCS